MNAYYNLDHLVRGIAILATHPGPIRDRLIAAFHGSLCHVIPALLPEPAAEIWDSIWQTVTAVPADDQEGVFRLSIGALDDAEAMLLARDILAIEPLVRVAIAGYGGPEAIH